MITRLTINLNHSSTINLMENLNHSSSINHDHSSTVRNLFQYTNKSWSFINLTIHMQSYYPHTINHIINHNNFHVHHHWSYHLRTMNRRARNGVPKASSITISSTCNMYHCHQSYHTHTIIIIIHHHHPSSIIIIFTCNKSHHQSW